MRHIDLTGRVFGMLTVTGKSHRNEKDGGRWHYHCQCECGGASTPSGKSLVRGLTRSCGCKEGGTPLELQGKVFGRLTALHRVASTKGKEYTWRCRCTCGREVVVRASCLNTGKTVSCGCLTKELAAVPKKHPTREIAARGALFTGYRISAERHDHKWELTLDDFIKITTQPCAYCGKPPELKRKTGSLPQVYSSGIDRVDNHKDYTLCNTVPCCKRCNLMKSNTTFQEFLNHCKAVVANFSNLPEPV